MIYTYSTKEAAKKALPDFCSKKEQDVFVYRVVYPSGVEYSLRCRNEIMSDTISTNEKQSGISWIHFLPDSHKFADFRKKNAYEKAERQRIVLENRIGERVTIVPHTKNERGEVNFSHYTLEYESKYKKK